MKDFYKCDVPGCNKIYVNNAILKRHVQAFHSSVNKFQCKICNKSLASRQNLKEHSFIHSGEKPYVCSYPGCTMSFRQGTHLSAHKKVHQANYICIDVKVLIEKISQMNKISEDKIQEMQIELPEIKMGCGNIVLPSIF